MSIKTLSETTPVTVALAGCLMVATFYAGDFSREIRSRLARVEDVQAEEKQKVATMGEILAELKLLAERHETRLTAAEGR